MEKPTKVIIIAGATATGKTELSLELAQRFSGEIINADSRQVYRLMDIGTAKPSREQRSVIPHHLIDVVYPDQEFNAQLYRERVVRAVEEIKKKQKNVFMVGGTGFYIRAYLEGLAAGARPDPEIRHRLAKEWEEKGMDFMYRKLMDIDPSLKSKIHPNDRYRIIRALEIYEVTGIVPSRLKEIKNKPEVEVLYICLKLDRKVIYDNIIKRVHRMIRDGFIEEVHSLLAKGYNESLRPLQSHGYKEMIDYLKGRITLEQAIAGTILRTKQYAKRQLTWFRGVKNAKWISPDEKNQIIELCHSFIEGML